MSSVTFYLPLSHFLLFIFTFFLSFCFLLFLPSFMCSIPLVKSYSLFSSLFACRMFLSISRYLIFLFYFHPFPLTLFPSFPSFLYALNSFRFILFYYLSSLFLCRMFLHIPSHFLSSIAPAWFIFPPLPFTTSSSLLLCLPPFPLSYDGSTCILMTCSLPFSSPLHNGLLPFSRRYSPSISLCSSSLSFLSRLDVLYLKLSPLPSL